MLSTYAIIQIAQGLGEGIGIILMVVGLSPIRGNAKSTVLDFGPIQVRTSKPGWFASGLMVLGVSLLLAGIGNIWRP